MPALTSPVFTPHKPTSAHQSKKKEYEDDYSDGSDYSDDDHHNYGATPTPSGSDGMNSPGFNTPPPRGLDGRKAKVGKKKDREAETDHHRLTQRAKQITYGENTQGFRNLCKILDQDPSLLKGCLPVKPSIFQKCSKRSWDGQIRKWRRALHMYDFVDFGESEEQSQAVKQKLIEQTKNPLFSPNKLDNAPAEPVVSPKPSRVQSPRPEVKVPEVIEMAPLNRVKYTIDQLFAMEASPLVSKIAIKLPEALHWLDKRFDLEDEFDDDTLSGYLPATPSRSPHPFNSPSPMHHSSHFTPGTPTPFGNLNTTPTRSTPVCPGTTPHRSNPTPCRAVSFPERTPGKTNLFA